MRQRLISLLLLAGLAACGPEPVVQEEGRPPLWNYSSMKTAVAEAQATLPAYWAAIEEKNPAYSAFALNVITSSERYTEEHVWLVDIRRTDDGNFVGTIPAAHEIDDGFTPGYMVAFQASHIADWRFEYDGKIYGAYTTRVMLNLAPDAEIDNIRARFHESPVP